jgi:hypothetical protein
MLRIVTVNFSRHPGELVQALTLGLAAVMIIWRSVWTHITGSGRVPGEGGTRGAQTEIGGETGP